MGACSRRKGSPTAYPLFNQYAAIMPRTMLRYAIEHLDKKQRELYMKMAS